MDGDVPNVSEMEDTVLQGDVYIDVILPESTLHQYSNTECNNYYNSRLMNCKLSTSNNLSVSTLTSPYITSKTMKHVHYKIKYMIRSTIQNCLKLKQDLFVVQMM